MSKSKRRKSNIQSIVVGAKQRPSPSTGSESSPSLSLCQEVRDKYPLHAKDEGWVRRYASYLSELRTK